MIKLDDILELLDFPTEVRIYGDSEDALYAGSLDGDKIKEIRKRDYIVEQLEPNNLGEIVIYVADPQ